MQMEQSQVEENEYLKLGPQQYWYFDSFRIRIRLKLGIDVPKLASFEIRPFVEFYWKKTLPSNLVPYRP